MDRFIRDEENKIYQFFDEEQLDIVSGGAKKVDQYAVKPLHIYTIYFPMQHGPFDIEPYGKRSGNHYNICVYEVFEEDCALGGLFGTNRCIRGIDIDNGEYVKVRINCSNVWEYQG